MTARRPGPPGWFCWASTVAVIGGIVWLVVACSGGSATAEPEPASTISSRVRVETVRVGDHDITCILRYRDGISCDWNHPRPVILASGGAK